MQTAVNLFFEKLTLGQFVQAEQVLLTIDFKGQAGERTRLHYQAQLLMHQNKFQEAILHLLKAEQTCGEYIGLIIELCNCYYQLGHMSLFRAALQKALVRFSEISSQLSPDRAIKYSIWLAKNLEDEGQIYEAIQYYIATANRAVEINHEAWLTNSRTHLLRLHSIFRNQKALADLYRSVLSSNTKSLSTYQNYEIQHALCLSEAVLLGAQHGWLRLEQILFNETLASYYKRFALADFISHLANDELQMLRPNLINALSFIELDHSDAFESYLFSRLESQNFNIFNLNLLTSQISCYAWLRLLVWELRQNETSARSTLTEKFNLFIASYSDATKKQWRNLLSTELSNERQALLLHWQQSNIAVNGQTLRLRSTEYVARFLDAVFKQNQNNSIVVCEYTYQQEYDPVIFDRMRMMVSRLNSEIARVSGIAKAIQVSKTHVRVNFKANFNHD